MDKLSFCGSDRGGNLANAYFLECVVLSPKLYMLIQLSSSISVNCDFQNIQLHSSHVNEYSAAIHNDC